MSDPRLDPEAIKARHAAANEARDVVGKYAAFMVTPIKEIIALDIVKAIAEHWEPAHDGACSASSFDPDGKGCTCYWWLWWKAARALVEEMPMNDTRLIYALGLAAIVAFVLLDIYGRRPQ